MQQNSNYQNSLDPTVNPQNSLDPNANYQNSLNPTASSQRTEAPVPPIQKSSENRPGNKRWILYAAFAVVLVMIVAVSIIIGINLANSQDSTAGAQANANMQSNSGNQTVNGAQNSNGNITGSEPNQSENTSGTTPSAGEDNATVPPTTVPATAPEAEPTVPETDPSAVTNNAATEILDSVWQAVPQSERFFVMGGDMNAMVSDGAGNYSLEDEGLTASLHVPADQVANLTCASSLMHGMLPNYFTCGLYQVSGDAAAFAEAMKASIGSVQWVCGQPEKLLISVINEEFVLVAFGLNDNIALLETAMTAAYPQANILYRDAITG